MSLPAAAAAPTLERPDKVSRYAFVFAFVSSTALLVSIAVSHICLVVALILLGASKTRLRMPPVVWPLAGFLGWTVLSILASDDPASGWPQIKKFFVFTILLVVYSLFPKTDQARRLMEAWFACTLFASVWSIVQFVQTWLAAYSRGQDFYQSYVGHRISGFLSHWMTFSEVTLIIFLVLLSYVMFSAGGARRTRAIWFGCGIIFGASLVLSFTRGVWLALAVASSYLVWRWKLKLLFAGPGLVVVALLFAPPATRQRLESIVSPSQNPERVVMWRTGWEMIQAHPWLGVGPEQVGPRFGEFLPDDVDELPLGYYGHLHSVYVHYAAERGVPALFMLLWLMAVVLRDHLRVLRKLRWGRSDQRFVLHAVIAATVGVLVAGCFDLTLGDSEILGLFLTLVALGYRTVEQVERQARADGRTQATTE